MLQGNLWVGGDAHSRGTARRMQGFTLIEIMVVVVILGILAAMIVPKIISRPEQAKITVAKSDVMTIATALSFYKLDNGRYPTTQQGLDALVHKPTLSPQALHWNAGGYLPKVPKDPWGHDYHYVSPGHHGAYDIFSLGPDRQNDKSPENGVIGNWQNPATSGS